MVESKRSKNSLLMQEVNDRVFGLMSELDIENGEFQCECSDVGCFETIQLTRRDYAALQKAEDRPPLMVAGHSD